MMFDTIRDTLKTAILELEYRKNINCITEQELQSLEERQKELLVLDMIVHSSIDFDKEYEYLKDEMSNYSLCLLSAKDQQAMIIGKQILDNVVDLTPSEMANNEKILDEKVPDWRQASGFKE